MIEIFRLSLRDFWTRKFIILSILPLTLSIFVLGFGLIWAGGSLSEAMSGVLESGDFGYFNLSQYPFFEIILESAVLKWFLGAVFYLFGTYLVLIISVFVALIVAGFLTPIVAREINERHYRIKLESSVSNTYIIKLMVGVVFKFLGILLVCVPLLFMPIINFFIISVPFFYIYHKFMLIDVASNVLSDTKFRLAYLEGGGAGFSISCFVFYFLCLVPFVGLFFQLFFIIFLTHLLFRRYFITSSYKSSEAYVA